MNNLVEGEDYYFNEQGFVVLTAKYHLQKGSCCGNGCKHCPYNYENVAGPQRGEAPPNLSNGEASKRT